MRSIARIVAVVVIAMLATWTAIAAGRKVLVLPVEGDADAAQRTKLTAQLLKATRVNGGDVSAGTTTFGETAIAVGCDPATPACGDTVLATLGVDEIVFGTATSANGQTTLVVTRIAKGQPRRDQSVVIVATDPPDKTETDLKAIWSPPAAVVGSGSAGSAATVGSAAVGSGSGSDVGSAAPASGESFFDTRERKLGFGFVGGGAVALVIGLALWSSESSVQTEINNAPNSSANDIQNLRVLEDRASAYAWEGNILVVLGLAAGGVGAYYLWTDHKARASATVVPIDHGTGAAVVVGGRW